MKMNKTYKYNISNIQIKGNLLSWENNFVRSSAIAQVWSGSTPLAVGGAIWCYFHRPVKMAGQINIRLISGEIISFLSESNDSAKQFYEALKSLADKTDISVINFDKDGKLQEKESEEIVPSAPAILELTSKSTSNQRLLDELKKLYSNYEKKTDADSEILLLISDAANLIETGNLEALKTSFAKFVTLGLIGDCNELGLDTLIQEIKSSLY